MGRPAVNDTICAVEGCGLLTIAFNRCSNHYTQWKRAVKKAGRWPLRHGRISTYHNYHCRCSPCRKAASEEHAENFVTIGVGPYKTATVSVAPDYWQRWKDYCARRNFSMRTGALAAINEYMENHPV
jgi:hypothetical protein